MPKSGEETGDKKRKTIEKSGFLCGRVRRMPRGGTEVRLDDSCSQFIAVTDSLVSAGQLPSRFVLYYSFLLFKRPPH